MKILIIDDNEIIINESFFKNSTYLQYDYIFLLKIEDDVKAINLSIKKITIIKYDDYLKHLKNRLVNFFEEFEKIAEPEGLDKVFSLSVKELTKYELYIKLKKEIWYYWIIIKIKDTLKNAKIESVDFNSIATKNLIPFVKLVFKNIHTNKITKDDSNAIFIVFSTIISKIKYRFLYVKYELMKIFPSRIEKINSTILFSCFSYHNAWQMKLIKDKLPTKISKNVVFISSRPKTGISLKKNGYKSQNISDFLGPDSYFKIRKMSRRFNKKFNSLDFNSKESNLDKFIINKCKVYFKKNYYQIICYVYSNINAFKILKPAILVTDMQWFVPDKAQVMVAKYLFKIPTVWMQHGEVSIDYFQTPMHSDKAFVWGDYYKNIWVKLNEKEEKFEITGSIPLDKLLKVKSKKLLRKKYGFGQNDNIISYFPQPAHSKISEFELSKKLGWIISSAMNFSDLKFIIKPHPKAPIKNNFISFKKNENIFLISDINSNDLIKMSDIIITIYSTIGFNALFLNKFLIVLDEKDRGNYFQEGVAKKAESVKDLEYLIKLYIEKKILLNKNDRKKFILNYITPSIYNDSSSRAAGLIKKSIQIK